MSNPKIKVDELTIEGVVYVPKDSIFQPSTPMGNYPFVVIRGYGSGVQFGYLKQQNGTEVILLNSRRIWNWTSATETNQIAKDGIGKDSKVTEMINEKIITDMIECLFTTAIAQQNLENQSIWKK